MKEWKNPTWIWCNSDPQKDEYAEFYEKFTYSGGKVILRISVDSNYAFYMNGELCEFDQYTDFPHDKVYDEIDITKYCKQGENHAAILAWYFGIDTAQMYFKGNAALAYEISCDGEVIAKSDEDTLSRLSREYYQHMEQSFSPQLVYSFYYLANQENNWRTGELDGFGKSVKVSQDLPLRPRPCKKLVTYPEVVAKPIKTMPDGSVIYDLGVEVAGFFKLEAQCEREQKISFHYTEKLNLGDVPRYIGPRDFSVHYHTKVGKNSYMNPLRRIAVRYFKAVSDQPLCELKISMVPTMYELDIKPMPKGLNDNLKTLYQKCINTLRLCMHEHSEDCPWREQARYTMDSRNQMLCGYYAFGEYEFPRANLQLISKDNRPDGLLSICYPASCHLVIPSFSLHYVVQCEEYLRHSGDLSLIEEVYPKLKSVLQIFIDNMKDGLCPQFYGNSYWNYYEWTDMFSGGYTIGEISPCMGKPDLLGNTLLSIALQSMEKIEAAMGLDSGYGKIAATLNKNIKETFYDEKNGAFFTCHGEGKSYTELGQSWAILCGAITGEEAEKLAFKLTSGYNGFVRVSLSMMCYKYDAVLKADYEKYKGYVIWDIQKTYSAMIHSGDSTLWEYEHGPGWIGASSLCHGWSAMPLYYMHTLSEVFEEE